MSYQFTTKRLTRLIVAIVVSFAMIFTGFALMPVSDTNSYAAENDTALTVTLTGAKTSTYQEYYAEDEPVYVPSTDGSGVGTTVIATEGSIYVGATKPYLTPVYDEAALWVYLPNAEEWTVVDSVSLKDKDAAELARVNLNASIASALPPLTWDQQRAAWDAHYATPFSKTAFEFHFDSKYNGMKATVQYLNRAKTVAAFGQIPNQTIGGYFGDPDDYIDNKVAAIQTFTLGAGSKTFALKKAVFETLKVTPVSGPMDENNYGVDTELDKYQETYGYASLITDDRGGTIEKLAVPRLSLYEDRWDPAIKDTKRTYFFSNPATGTYIFPALPGQKLLFRAAGGYRDGSKNADGTLKASKSYQGQWLGGYKAGDIDIVGNPKTVKKVTVGKKNATVGTIKLGKGTATIKGTLTNADDTVIANGVAKDQYISYRTSTQDTVVATFAEYAAANDGKKTSKKNVWRTPVYIQSNETEYIANETRNEYATLDSFVTPFDGVEVTKAEWDKLPDPLKYSGWNDTNLFTGVRAYYRENWTEVTEVAYNALPDVLQARSIAGKYYQDNNYVQVDQAAYNLLIPELRVIEEMPDGTDAYFKYTPVLYYKNNVAAATEAEYIADQSGEYADEVSVTSNYKYTAVDQAAYDALATNEALQGPIWTDAAGTKTYYKNNYTEITKDVYDTLPPGVRTYDSYFDSGIVAYTYHYYKADWATEIDKATYDKLPENLRYQGTVAPVPATATTPATTASFKYFKYTLTYAKVISPYVYWKNSPTYKIENLPSGVYAVNWGGQTKVITVKAGKTYTFNLKAEKYDVKAPYVNTNVTGTKKKGKKLTASTYIDNPGFGAGNPKYSYYWTDGAKVVSKKAALKLTKKTAKKNLWVISVAKIGSYRYPTSNGWQAAPGNKWGAIAFDVTVTGTFKKGKKIKANISNKQVAGVKYKYQWLRNGKAIKKATKATYKLTAKDKGKKISVKVIGTRDGFTSKTVKSKAKKSK